MSATAKIQHMTINGHPYTCPECGGRAFTLDGGRFDIMPADANCLSSHHWVDPLITTGTLTMILGSRSGRTKARHEDTFSVTVGGARLEGTLVPEIVYDDVKQLSRVYWTRIIKPAVRKKKRAAVRAAKRPVKQAVRHTRDVAAEAVAAGKSAALAASWTAQAGGYDPGHTPEPVIPCDFCDGKGYFAIDTNLHNITQTGCPACRGTGETL